MTWRTEEEAKKRWCPMVRVVLMPGGTVMRDGKPAEVPDIVVTNRGEAIARLGDKPIPCKCIASGCEWWDEEPGGRDGKPTGRGRCGAASRCAS